MKFNQKLSLTTLSKHGKPSYDMQKNLVKSSYFLRYLTSKLAKVTVHIKESSQLCFVFCFDFLVNWQEISALLDSLGSYFVDIKFLNDERVPYKVIIHKSRGEESLVEQDTIEKVSVAYLKFIFIILGTIFKKKINFLFLAMKT